MSEKTYQIKIGGLKRELPLIKISDSITIASFVLLGDDELARKAAEMLNDKQDGLEYDAIVTVESKGIILAHELAMITGKNRSYVIRKSVKGYMNNPLKLNVKSITTTEEQTLVLNGDDAAQLKNKRVLIVDDVISTGDSIKEAAELVTIAGGKVVGKAAILAEGAAANRKYITYLAPLPLFDSDGNQQNL